MKNLKGIPLPDLQVQNPGSANPVLVGTPASQRCLTGKYTDRVEEIVLDLALCAEGTCVNNVDLQICFDKHKLDLF